MITGKEFARLFSETEQKEFARKDYLGLNREEAALLEKKRSDYAKTLLKNYRDTMKDVDNFDFSSYDNIRSRGRITAGGVETTYQVKNPTKLGKAAHKNDIRKQMTEQIHEAGDIMREQVKNDANINHSGSKINKYTFDKDLRRKLKNSADNKAENEVAGRAKKVAEGKAMASKASIEKHKNQAEGLRKNNKLNVAVRDAKRWIKKNPGKSAAIGAGALAIGTGIGYGVKKAVDKKKNKKD